MLKRFFVQDQVAILIVLSFSFSLSVVHSANSIFKVAEESDKKQVRRAKLQYCAININYDSTINFLLVLTPTKSVARLFTLTTNEK